MHFYTFKAINDYQDVYIDLEPTRGKNTHI